MLISHKIHERFPNLLSAFRYFDGDHELSLSLNEFAQGIEHLRIKVSFEDVKAIFNYLDADQDNQISYAEFKLLSEDNWRKMDPMARYLSNMDRKEKDDKSVGTSKISDQGSSFKSFNRRSELKAMDFCKLEKISCQQNKSKASMLAFNERSFNEELSTSSKQMRSTQASFYMRKPNKIDPSSI